MNKRTYASLAVMAALGSLLPINTYAFGLGKIQINSALNEKFNAEVPITALKEDEEGSLQVQLASNREYELAGLERSFLLTQFKFDVEGSGTDTKIRITSNRRIKEPFLDLLLTASTGNGRLIREYTVLLDPPTEVFQKKRVEQKAPAYPDATKEVTSKQSQSVSSYQKEQIDSYGPVKRTDTLWDVALNAKADSSVTIHQMMMALLKENPTAFLNNNINGLKSGYTLTIPTNDQVLALSRSQAIAKVAEQNELWKNRRAKQSENNATSTEETSLFDNEQNSSSKTPVNDTTTLPETLESETNSRLELIAPNEQSDTDDNDLSPFGNDTLSELSQQLTLAQETIEGQAQENVDIQARMDVMEQQIQTLRKLISLKDEGLARLQNTLEENGLEASLTDSELVTESELIAEESVETKGLSKDDASENNIINLVEELAESDSNNVDNQPDTSILTDSTDSIPEALPETNVTEVIETNASNSDSNVTNEQEGTLFNKVRHIISSNLYNLGLAITALLLLLIGLIISKRKKQDDEPETVENEEITPEVTPEPITQFEPEVDAEMVPYLPELDEPVVQSEYENTVENASELDIDLPKQDEKVQTEFNNDEVTVLTSAGQDKTTIEDEQLESDNNEALDFTVQPIDLDEKTTPEVEPSDDLSISIEKTDFDNNIDFELTDDNEVKSDLSLEPVLNEPSDLSEITTNIDISTEETQPELDIPLDLGSDDSDAYEFELDDFDHYDEAETKLDLASAYIEMGDPEGAKNILQEVLDEGSDEQKERAQTMINGM